MRDGVPAGLDIVADTPEARQGGLGGFCFTSNIDGHWERAGFSPARILSCHGALTNLQCTRGRRCPGPQQGVAQTACSNVWPTPEDLYGLQIDPSDMEKLTDGGEKLPKCEFCKEALARPNVLMFGDGEYVDRNDVDQYGNYCQFMAKVDAAYERGEETGREGVKGVRLVVLKISAKKAVPTVRHQSEKQAFLYKATALIRINLNDCNFNKSKIPYVAEENAVTECIEIPLKKLDAISQINDELMKLRG